MMSFAEPKLEIVLCDNGYVVEWRDERRRDLSHYSAGLPETPTYGVKIFTTKKDVVAFLNTFFERK